MNLHEYQAKQLFAEYGLPVSQGIAVDTADEAVAAAKEIGGDKWVIKTLLVNVHESLVIRSISTLSFLEWLRRSKLFS